MPDLNIIVQWLVLGGSGGSIIALANAVLAWRKERRDGKAASVDISARVTQMADQWLAKADLRLKETEARAADAESRVSELETRVSTLERDLATERRKATRLETVVSLLVAYVLRLITDAREHGLEPLPIPTELSAVIIAES